MANGICVYAESYNGELETVAAELVSAAKGLAETTKEKVQAIVLSDHAEELVSACSGNTTGTFYFLKSSDASWLWYDCGLYRGSGCSERRRFFLY